ncbi:MAG: hypothetical protein ACREO8_04570 [Luteimonas sp.]
MNIRWLFLFVGAWLLTVFAASAQTSYRVDDSASQVLGSTLRLKPLSPIPRGPQATLVAGDITVLVRLDVSPWKGRQGRIYMTLPPQPVAAITATWSTQGRLLPGTLRAGERTLVHAGPIHSDRIEDTLRLTIQADGRKFARDEQLAFWFEIDLETP